MVSPIQPKTAAKMMLNPSTEERRAVPDQKGAGTVRPPPSIPRRCAIIPVNSQAAAW